MEPAQETNGHSNMAETLDQKPRHFPLHAPDAILNPLRHPICFSHPQRLSPCLDWQQHIPFAMLLVDLLKPDTIVEVGLAEGDSYCAFCQAVQQLNLGTACTGIVLCPPAGDHPPDGPAVRAELRAHHDPRYGSFSTLVTATPDHALHQFRDRCIDLLHLDGPFSDQAARHLFDVWLPKLSDRAVVLIHDVNVPDGDGGTRRLWEEIKPQYPHFEFFHGNGLGVVVVGQVCHPELLMLSSATGAEAAEVRHFFFQLGQRLTAKAEFELRERILLTAAQQEEGQRRHKDQVISELTQQLAEKGHSLHLLSTKLSENEKVARLLYDRTEELSQAYRRLSTIEESSAWKTLQALRRGIERLLPPGTRRGKVQRLAWRGLGLWRQQGTRAVLARTVRKVRSAVFRRVIVAWDRLSSGGSSKSQGNADVLVACEELGSPPNATVFGSVLINGWALARMGIERIEISLNRQLVGCAQYGTFRPDVFVSHPDFTDAEQSGFRWTWDTTTVRDGRHRMVIRAIAKDGGQAELVRPVVVDNTTPHKSDYLRWIEMHEPKELLEARQQAAALTAQPVISLVMPVYNTDPALLQHAINSVTAQIYPQWELCICDDGSTRPEVRPVLAAAAARDARIKVAYAQANSGIAGASNQALALATGAFIALLDSDDEIPAHALYQLVRLLNNMPDADLVYSDEDKIDLSGRRYDPFFKPDWSPDLLLSCNYVCHFTAIRASLLKEVGGFRSEYDGSQDYDLYLRVAEKTERIHHIPKVLYHWRAAPSSTASGAQVRMTAHDAARKALQDHLARTGVTGIVMPGNSLGRWRVKYKHTEQPTVALIIPTGGNTQLLQQCLRGITEKTTYRHFEFVIVDNSRGDDVQKLLPSIQALGPKTCSLDFRNKAFNFSLLNNCAVRCTAAPLVLFLNDDTMPVDPEWLEAMVEHALRPEVGAVGPKLIYSDNTIQHAGVVMGIYANTGHAFKYLSADERVPVYFDLPHVIRNCSVVTGACLMTRREVFLAAGGFEEVHLPVAFQDVDYCLKLRARGFRVIYTPHARLIHYEAKTKAEKIPNPYEVRYMQQHWAHVIAHDPYYNPNLTRLREDYSLALPY